MRSNALTSFIALAAVLAGCGATVTHAGQDAGPTSTADTGNSADAPVSTLDAVTVEDDAGSADVPFVMAPHTPYPTVANNGGPVLSSVRVIAITYAEDPNAASDIALMQYLVGSNWLTTVGADYGVGTGTVVQSVMLSTPAPMTITSTELETNIIQEINSGTVMTGMSSGSDPFANYLYVVFYPATTTITETVPGLTRPMTSCRSYGGYHDAVDMGQYHFAYAVIPDCGASGGMSDADGISVAASHELIEAASDALPLTHPAYLLDISDQASWDLLSGPEIGDLCDQINVTVDGYLLQRVWSNTAAASNLDPCIPAPSGMVGFNVSTPDNVVSGAAGSQVTVTLTGWSTAPIDDWQILAMPEPFNLSANINAHAINNGQTATLTITIPANATADRQYGVVIESIRSNEVSQWPISILIQ